MAAGLGFKTFTTGEVLTAADTNGYLMQGILVFASAAARTSAITSPQEGQYSYLKDTNALEYYDGAAWVGAPVGDITAVTAGKGLTGGGSSGDVTVSLGTTAKGDLVAGSGASTAAVLPVGTNGQVLTADSTASTGLAWATPSVGSTNVAGKNGVLNSNFSVWQRGTSAATGTTGQSYQADRWNGYRAVAGATISRQATNDTTNLPFIQYCARVQRDSGNTATNSIILSNNFETVNSLPYAGKSVTLSFYARAGANFSAASSLIAAQVITGTGTDQNWITGYTGQAVPINQTATLTTTWQRFSYSGTIASTATEIAVDFNYAPTGTAGANDYFEVTGVQLEIASSASAYSPNTSTYQAELSACQRYFERYASASGSVFYTGFQQTSTSPRISASIFAKRTTPTITLTGAGTGQVMVTSGTTYNITSIDAIAYAEGANTIGFRANIASGGTAGDACALYSNAGIVNIDYSSEL